MFRKRYYDRKYFKKKLVKIMKKLSIVIIISILMFNFSCKDEEIIVPKVNITGINQDQVIWQNYTIILEPEDISKVQYIKLFLGDKLIAWLYGDYQHTINTLDFEDGPYLLKAIAYDEEDNPSEETSLQIYIQNIIFKVKLDPGVFTNETIQNNDCYFIIENETGNTKYFQIGNELEYSINRTEDFYGERLSITYSSFSKTFGSKYFFTWRDIKVGQTYFWENEENNRGEYINQTEISFEDIPENNQSICNYLSTIYLAHTDAPLENDDKLPYRVYSKENRFYIGLYTDSGFKYKYTTIPSGINETKVSLSDLETEYSNHKISAQINNLEFVSASVNGYKSNDFKAWDFIKLFQSDSENINKTNIYIPNVNDINFYETELIYYDANNDTYYKDHYWKNSVITNFQKINTSINMNFYGSEIELDINGDYQYFRIHASNGGYSFNWHLVGNNHIHSQYPIIPYEILNKHNLNSNFGEYIKSIITFTGDHTHKADYDDMMESSFNTKDNYIFEEGSNLQYNYKIWTSEETTKESIKKKCIKEKQILNPITVLKK